MHQYELHKTLTYFNESLKKVSKPKTKVSEVITGRWHGVINRLNARTCELCGIKSNNNKDFVVHYVRKLKDLLEKYNEAGFTPPMWVLGMKGIKRKTLIVCGDVIKKSIKQKETLRNNWRAGYIERCKSGSEGVLRNLPTGKAL